MLSLPDGRQATPHREDDSPLPTSVQPVDDTLSAKAALARVRRGEYLLWTGDWHNGRQLLSAMKRRIRPPRALPTEPAGRWRAERAHTGAVAEQLGRVYVVVEADNQVDLRRAPDTREALTWAFGTAPGPRLIPLRTVIGALGAAGWTRKGLTVPGLQGTLIPRYGVFSPTRHAYVGLLDAVDFEGRHVLDTGCGTGVIGLIALQRGASHVWAVDTEPRAVACARDNAARLGPAERYDAGVHDLFWPDQRFDLALFNPPWLPEPPRTRLDRAIFDDGGVVRRWVEGLPGVLTPEGRGVLLISDLAVRLGLRDPEALPGWIAGAGLEVVERAAVPASHGRVVRKSETAGEKTDREADPVALARSREKVWRWVVAPAARVTRSRAGWQAR